MKRTLIYFSVFAISAGALWSGCKKAQHHPGQDTASNLTAPNGQAQSQTATSQGTATSENHGATQTAMTSPGTPATGAQAPANPADSAHATTTGAANTSPNGKVAEAVKVAEAPKEIPVTCFFETFTHKPMDGHKTEEDCSHHKNLIKLSHAGANFKTMCVRVNEVPVKFERAGNGSEILIGSIAGPHATISVRYCTGKTVCADAKKNDCVIPKDEFLDAIGGETDDGAVAQWDNTDAAGDAKLNADVKRELADIQDSKEQAHSVTAAAIFKQWINEKSTPACGQKHSS
jgi:hypothetical protein